MKNKRAFTLIELLAVITIIAILMTIITPVLVKLLNENKQKLYEQQTDTLVAAGKRWANDHTQYLSETTPYCISIETLADDGYISGDDLINPVDKKEMTGYVIAAYNSSYSQYVYEFAVNCNISSANQGNLS